MRWRDQQGFTIVETSMFLAISALLFVGLLGGVSLAVNRQRASDSVQSTLSFLQKQFNETLNVVNSRDVDPCAPSGSGEPVGASSCFVMGKAIQVFPGDGGRVDRIDVSSVVGHEVPAGASVSLQGYFDRVVDDANRQEYLMPWGARVAGAALLTKPALTPVDRILLLRSPENGATFVYAFPDENVRDLDTDRFRVSREQPVVLCLESLDVTGAFTAIRFNGSGSQDGIQASFDQEPSCGL